jgi:hypothetical protein
MTAQTSSMRSGSKTTRSSRSPRWCTRTVGTASNRENNRLALQKADNSVLLCGEINPKRAGI